MDLTPRLLETSVPKGGQRSYQKPRIMELGRVTGLTLGNTSGTNPDIGEHQNNPDEPNTGFNCGHGSC